MSIQYIRAVAAVIVIVWHTGWARTVLGQSGVDLFFVVSGFVMMMVSGRERSPGRFGFARLARIVPLYWSVTVVVALITKPESSELVSSLLFWPDGDFPVVIQGWSLNLEMLYYLLFAVTLLAPFRWRLHVLALEIAVVCLVLPLILPHSVPLAAWSSPLAFEFLAGAGLYVVWQRNRLPTGLAAWLLGAIAVVGLGFTHLLGGGPTGWLRVTVWGVPALAIVAAGLGIERAGQLPRVPLLGTLGEASYAIYLTHFLAINLVSADLRVLGAPIAVPIAVVWSCVVGWVIHRLFELPVNRLMSGLLNAIWPKTQSVAG